MKICYIHQYYLSHEAAGGTRSYTMARRLVHHGHDVTMITGAINYMTGEIHPSVKGRLVSRRVEDGITIYRINPLFPHKSSYLLRALGFITFMFGS